MFKNNSTILVDGHYNFLPDGAPHYPGFHNLGSRIWTSDERDPEPLIGEITSGKQKYHNGKPSGKIPMPVLIGNADCIENGEQWPLSLPLRTLVGGYDSRCPLFVPIPVPPPLPPLDVRDPSTQCLFADIQSDLYTAPDLARDQLIQLMGVGSTVAVVPNDASQFPGSLVGVLGDTTIVVISGTTNLTQWVYQLLGAVNGPTDYGIYSTLPIWHRASSVIIDRVNSSASVATGPIIVVGHSYGGAVASLVAARYANWQPARAVQLLTFGCPHPGDSRLIDLLRNLPQANLVNDGDVVTAVPPSGQLIAALQAIIPAGYFTGWNLWRMHTNRIGIDIIGRRRDNPNEVDLFGEVFNLVIRFIRGLNITAGFPHLMTEYVRRICSPFRLPVVALIIGDGGEKLGNAATETVTVTYKGNGGQKLGNAAVIFSVESPYFGTPGMLLGSEAITFVAQCFGDGGQLLGDAAFAKPATLPAGDGGQLLGDAAFAKPATLPAGDGGQLLGDAGQLPTVTFIDGDGGQLLGDAGIAVVATIDLGDGGQLLGDAGQLPTATLIDGDGGQLLGDAGGITVNEGVTYTGDCITGSDVIVLDGTGPWPGIVVGGYASGVGLPAGTTILAVSGANVFVSNAATATTTSEAYTFI